MASPVIWFTGLSGSGKTTLARALESQLKMLNIPVVVLDGDSLRQGLCANLGFTPENRSENIRRAAEVARLLSESGIVCIVAMISPYAADRQRARELIPTPFFIEVFVNTPLAECERRDPKGLYVKARSGEILHFTGISAPYEAPAKPELELRTAEKSVTDCITLLLVKLL